MGKRKRKSDAVAAVTQASDNHLEKHPRKKFFRQRPHSNPLSDHLFDIPVSPDAVDWSKFYPQYPNMRPDIVDIGCGYGSLVLQLGAHFPEQLVLGMEIREQVTTYVKGRIMYCRTAHSRNSDDTDESLTMAESLKEIDHGNAENCAVIRTNAMKFMPNYFAKAQLSHMFFCFPDPHFKAKKHKARIISNELLADYAYVLRKGGRIYTITDVTELGEWMSCHLDNHPLFKKIEDYKDDPCTSLLYKTDEARKIGRQNTTVSIYERI